MLKTARATLIVLDKHGRKNAPYRRAPTNHSVCSASKSGTMTGGTQANWVSVVVFTNTVLYISDVCVFSLYPAALTD